MAWYWWVLIGIGVILIGWLKLKVLNKWMERRKAANQPIEEE
jgi:hypothetical protein